METLQALRVFLRSAVGNSEGLSGVADPNALTVENTYGKRSSAGAFYDCNALNSYVLDGFLYTDEEQLALLPNLHNYYCEACKVTCSKRRCKDCKQHSQPRSQISCSVCIADLLLIHEALGDVGDLKIVDVGSRLGNALYYFALLSYAKNVIGVEMDPFFVKLTRSVCDKYGREWEDYGVDDDGNRLPPRVQMFEGDIRGYSPLLKEADVIVLNNPFEQLFSLEAAQELWYYVFSCCQRPGQRIVSQPPLLTVLKKIGMIFTQPTKCALAIDFDAWVEVLPCEGLPREFAIQRVR